MRTWHLMNDILS